MHDVSRVLSAIQQGGLVELRYFVGTPGDQAAEIPGISSGTAGRHQVFARAWLRREVQAGKAPEESRENSWCCGSPFVALRSAITPFLREAHHDGRNLVPRSPGETSCRARRLSARHLLGDAEPAFRRRGAIARDPDLAPLRDWVNFKKLLAELEKKPLAKRP